MSSKKIEKTRKKLRKIEKQRQIIISELLRYDECLRGSFATVYTKCGRDNCRCKDGKGHPYSRITWTDKGEAYTRKVPKDEIPWILKVTEHYRRFRLLRRQLKELEARSKSIVSQLERKIVEKTRKPKPYLWKKV